MQQDAFNGRLLEFLNAAPTPFHAVDQLASKLRAAGFTPLDEADDWILAEGHGYFTIRNQSSLVAFRHAGTATTSGIRMLGAHTDSPCLRLKATPVTRSNGLVQLGVEVYGGILMHPWFDRDLSIAGRVAFQAGDGRVRSALIDFRKPVACIPSLAIHLNREVNTNSSINAQKHLVPVVMQTDEPVNFDELLLARLLEDGEDAVKVLSHELSLYDCQPAGLVGLRDQFIAGARLDNLLSCFAGACALEQTSAGSPPALLVCNDHEEVGSTTLAGASGTFLRSVIERLLPEPGDRHRALARSMFLSCDNAHAVHPNHADRHDGNHGPLMNGGPVVKVNASQRYASTSDTIGLFRALCDNEKVQLQTFVMRSDLACGSTIGPLTAAGLGVRTLDIGVPTLAMHSIRELAGTRDCFDLTRSLTAFLRLAELRIDG